tara:strand:+ start:952 stop:2457 length:1506 start_codon:yes stop_codon:yes gene_type:complete
VHIYAICFAQKQTKEEFNSLEYNVFFIFYNNNMSEFNKSGNYTNGFYITLPEAKDRQAQFSNQMKKQPNLIIKPWFVDKKKERYTTDSHVACLKEAIKLGLSRVIVFEDDAILPEENIHKTIEAVDAELEGKWQVLISGHKTKNMRSGDVTKISSLVVKDGDRRAEGTLFRVHRSVAGCHAYTVNGVEAMSELIRIQSVSEYTGSGRIDVHDGWFKGTNPNKNTGRHCIEGSYLREQDLWFITDLAYVTEQHIDGYSYRMKDTKHARWDDENSQSWVKRLNRNMLSPPKNVLVLSYPGLAGDEVRKMCANILTETSVKGHVTLKVIQKSQDVVNVLRDWVKTSKSIIPGKKHVVFAVTGKPELSHEDARTIKKWSTQINKITKEKYKYDAEYERANNDRNRGKGMKVDFSEWRDFMFTVFHVEDFMKDAKRASQFLSMRLGMDANKLIQVGQNVAPISRASLQKKIDEVDLSESDYESDDDTLSETANFKFKDPLEKARYI